MTIDRWVTLRRSGVLVVLGAGGPTPRGWRRHHRSWQYTSALVLRFSSMTTGRLAAHCA